MQFLWAFRYNPSRGPRAFRAPARHTKKKITTKSKTGKVKEVKKNEKSARHVFRWHILKYDAILRNVKTYLAPKIRGPSPARPFTVPAAATTLSGIGYAFSLEPGRKIAKGNFARITRPA
jgi:hypothetical protein